MKYILIITFQIVNMNSLEKNREQENLDKIEFEGEQRDLDFGYYD